MAEIKSMKNILMDASGLFLEYQEGKWDQEVKTGIVELDDMLGGLQPGRLITLVSRPNVDKSLLALNIIHNVIRAKHGVLYCSARHDELETTVRLIGLSSGLKIPYPPKELPTDPKSLMQEIVRLKDLPLWVDPSCGLPLADTLAIIEQFAGEHKLNLVVIDPIHLFKFDSLPRAMAELKSLAEKLNLTLLVLADSRGEKIHLQDLPTGLADGSDTVMILNAEMCPSSTSYI